jgi:hypothetical protein
MTLYLSRFLLVASVAAVSSLQAGLVPFSPTTAGLINTGVNLSGATDLSWKILPSLEEAVVVSPTHNAWIPNNATSQWIWLDRSTTPAPAIDNVSIWLQLTFDLPATYDPANTTVTGLWAVDNQATMFLNGEQVAAAQNTFGGSSKTFSEAVNGFTLSDHFLSGENVLKINLKNFGGTSWASNPSGLNVRFSTLETSVIPEPSVLLGAMTMGVLGLLFIRRRR